MKHHPRKLLTLLARVLNHERADVSRTMFLMSSGLSTRCVKD